MRKIPGRAHAEIVSPDSPGARPAVLRYRVVGILAVGTWLENSVGDGAHAPDSAANGLTRLSDPWRCPVWRERTVRAGL